MSLKEKALKLHGDGGKLEMRSKIPLETRDDLTLAYTPGVGEVCLEVARDKELAYKYTFKKNVVGIVSDGSAVLGLGNLGPLGALPVMEGKALLFKAFAGVDAIPLCIATNDVDEIVNFVKWLEPTLGGVNLEDISAPRCFEIENRLVEELDIPVFHDDQHGTAVVVLAALINGAKVAGKDLASLKVVVNGAGAAGIATANLLMDSGIEEVLICDIEGIIFGGGPSIVNVYREETAKRGNKSGIQGNLSDALKGADVFVGLSGPNAVSADMVSLMAPKSIVLSMANPVPEIYPHDSKKGGAYVVGTGRSDFPNQVNNVLAFPGIFRGALDVRAKVINREMKIAAANAIASLVLEEELSPEHIIVDPFDKRVGPKVAREVSRAAVESGVARLL